MLQKTDKDANHEPFHAAFFGVCGRVGGAGLAVGVGEGECTYTAHFLLKLSSCPNV